MSKAKHTVEFTRDHEVVIPESELEISGMDGVVHTRIPVPEQRFANKAGERVTFASKRAALEFCKARNNACTYLGKV